MKFCPRENDALYTPRARKCSPACVKARDAIAGIIEGSLQDAVSLAKTVDFVCDCNDGSGRPCPAHQTIADLIERVRRESTEAAKMTDRLAYSYWMVVLAIQ